MKHTCGAPARQYCSWTPENPGRRFEQCNQRQGYRCSYWDWLEPEIPEETKGLINNLRQDGKLSEDKKLLIRHLLLNLWNTQAQLENEKARNEELQAKNEELAAQVQLYDEILGGKFDISDE